MLSILLSAGPPVSTEVSRLSPSVMLVRPQGPLTVVHRKCGD